MITLKITIIITIIIIAILSGTVGSYLFIKNNPKKAAKIEKVIDEITKKD